MMKTKLYLVSMIALSVFSATSMWGQKLKVDGEIRTRIEYRNGFKSPVADTLDATAVGALRTRINLSYSDEKINSKFTLQDARIFGETGTNDTKNSLGIFEAWGSYLFAPSFSVTLGRQAIEYDDKRLFSASNWSNGNAHDLMLWKFESDSLFKLHLGIAYNNAADDNYEKIYKVERSYKYLTYIWFGKSFKKLDFSALWVNDALEYGTKTDQKAYRNTIGGNLGMKKKEIPFSFYASGYYQFGHDATNKELNAYLLALTAQYQITNVWSISAGTDYFSGTDTDDAAKGKDKTFNKLYGTNHSFNGSMEYWTTLPAQGLFDLFGGVTFKPNTKFDINATFHSFALAKELPSTDKKGIGSEIDITANYTVSSQLAIQGGYSAYFKNDQTDILKKQVNVDTRFPQWAYIMLTFKPKFFNK
jgi:hypothetical protein